MKVKLLIGLILLTSFCALNISAQTNSESEEKLITEFIKLKNVPDCNEKDSIKCVGQKIGYKRFFNTVKIYLTERGSIEFDRRSKFLIVTEVSSRIEFIKGIISSVDRFEIFLIDENEEDEYEKSECIGYEPSDIRQS